MAEVDRFGGPAVDERGVRAFVQRKLVGLDERVDLFTARPLVGDTVNGELALDDLLLLSRYHDVTVSTPPPGASRCNFVVRGPLLAIPRNAVAIAHDDAYVGLKPPRERGNAVGLFEIETFAPVRKRDDPGAQPQSFFDDLGVARSLRRMVVEQHHPVGEHHRSGRPSDDGLAVE